MRDTFIYRAMLLFMAMLHDRDPEALAAALHRLGFSPGNVQFRKTKAKPRRTMTTIVRWPWSRREQR